MTLKTLGMGIAKLATKTKGRMVKDKKTRDVIAGALKEHRASKSYKMHKKTMQKIPHDLTYMKGYLKGKD